MKGTSPPRRPVLRPAPGEAQNKIPPEHTCGCRQHPLLPALPGSVTLGKPLPIQDLCTLLGKKKKKKNEGLEQRQGFQTLGFHMPVTAENVRAGKGGPVTYFAKLGQNIMQCKDTGVAQVRQGTHTLGALSVHRQLWTSLPRTALGSGLASWLQP